MIHRAVALVLTFALICIAHVSVSLANSSIYLPVVLDVVSWPRETIANAPTAKPSATQTLTSTPTATRTATPTPTSTSTPTNTPTSTSTSTPTETSTPTPSLTPSPVAVSLQKDNGVRGARDCLPTQKAFAGNQWGLIYELTEPVVLESVEALLASGWFRGRANIYAVSSVSPTLELPLYSSEELVSTGFPPTTVKFPISGVVSGTILVSIENSHWYWGDYWPCMQYDTQTGIPERESWFLEDGWIEHYDYFASPELYGYPMIRAHGHSAQ